MLNIGVVVKFFVFLSLLGLSNYGITANPPDRNLILYYAKPDKNGTNPTIPDSIQSQAVISLDENNSFIISSPEEANLNHYKVIQEATNYDNLAQRINRLTILSYDATNRVAWCFVSLSPSSQKEASNLINNIKPTAQYVYSIEIINSDLTLEGTVNLLQNASNLHQLTMIGKGSENFLGVISSNSLPPLLDQLTIQYSSLSDLQTIISGVQKQSALHLKLVINSESSLSAAEQLIAIKDAKNARINQITIVTSKQGGVTISKDANGKTVSLKDFRLPAP